MKQTQLLFLFVFFFGCQRVHGYFQYLDYPEMRINSPKFDDRSEREVLREKFENFKKLRSQDEDFGKEMIEKYREAHSSMYSAPEVRCLT